MSKLDELRRRLEAWYLRRGRDLPWRSTRDPYRIWVSEVMLQQTRAATVIPYYQKFLKRFPDVASLARAPEQALLKSWSGLGYYSRARNLQKAARRIEDAGGFPDDHASIRRLPGVGDYTAAAIASIAFNLPHAVLDGNVFRVLSRLSNETGDIGSAITKKRLRELAEELLDRKQPGRFNQALMELGATVCLPREPRCLLCPISESCEARRQGTQNQLPVKLRRGTPVRVEKILLIIERQGKLLLWQRGTGAGMAGFWELPEADQLPQASRRELVGEFRHSIMNHRYFIKVAPASLARAPRGFRWIPKSRLNHIPLSTMATKALRSYLSKTLPN